MDLVPDDVLQLILECGDIELLLILRITNKRFRDYISFGNGLHLIRKIIHILTHINIDDFDVNTLISMYHGYRTPNFLYRTKLTTRQVKFIEIGPISKGRIVYNCGYSNYEVGYTDDGKNEKLFGNVVKSLCYPKDEIDNLLYDIGCVIAITTSGILLVQRENEQFPSITLEHPTFADIIPMNETSTDTYILLSSEGNIYEYCISANTFSRFYDIDSVSKIISDPINNYQDISFYFIMSGKLYQYVAGEVTRIFKNLNNVIDFRAVAVGVRNDIHSCIITSNKQVFFDSGSGGIRIDMEDNIIYLSRTLERIVFLTNKGDLYVIYSNTDGFQKLLLIQRRVLCFSCYGDDESINFILFDDVRIKTVYTYNVPEIEYYE